ncbi:ASCH domain-containing protein [Antrihabitans spumae]|jgi:predicted transcriptional regulator|uniref:ASCH domain-containing protein n=1 Tax=Antrihabitans spumae TaxID=3373370 RepID=A0ABW7K633_9NOCA
MTELMESVHEDGAADNGRSLLVSVRPRYAEAILRGSKTIELRRTKPKVNPGTLVVLYSSSPVKAVVGWAIIETVIEASPVDMWKYARSAAAIATKDYYSYFAGAERAFGLVLRGVTPATTPVPLRSLRELGVEPPQSWRYLKFETTEQIRNW